MDTQQVSKVKTGRSCVLCSPAWPCAASANDRDKAKRIHDRIAGVPPSEATLDAMEALVAGGNPLGAANIATQAPSFYNVTLKNMAVPWTNRDQTVFAPLNDYVATFIGMVRDDVAVQHRAVGRPDLHGERRRRPAASAVQQRLTTRTPRPTRSNLFTALTPTTQSSVQGIPPAATAGFITSRAASEAFFVDGTNRAMFRFTHDEPHVPRHGAGARHLAAAGLHPPGREPQPRWRQPHLPEQLHRLPQRHGSAVAQAFAYYDYDNGSAEAPGSMRLVYTAGAVQPKYFNNNTNFAPGFITPDDAWENRWRKGQNSLLGWSGSLPGSGNGAKSMGEELANSDAFAQCQVEKVFKTVCFRAPGDSADRARGRTTDDHQLQEQRLPAETGLRRNRCVLHGRLREHT